MWTENIWCIFRVEPQFSIFPRRFGGWAHSRSEVGMERAFLSFETLLMKTLKLSRIKNYNLFTSFSPQGLVYDG